MKNHKQKIISILKRFEIPYWIEGKNVSIDSINIQCPFCNDHSNHCGIFQNTMIFNCWRCNARGPFERLLVRLTNFSELECKKIIEDFDTTFKENTVDQIISILNNERKTKKHLGIKEVMLPEYFEKVTLDIVFPLLFKYLKRRKISLNTVIKAGCGICRVGKYMNRLVIPIYFHQTLVAFQAADLSGFAHLKYKTGPAEVFINDYLYDYDNIGKRMVVTEGILDAWRTGDDAVATFGTHFTERQKQLVLDKKLDELIVAWDGEAYWPSRKEADFFRPFIEKVKVVELPQGEDPDSLGKEKILNLIEEIV